MKYILHTLLILALCLFANSYGFAQETLEEKRERADNSFDEQQWITAENLYASIISSDPRNHDLNFRYGTSLLYGSKNKEEAIKRLRFAITGANVDKTAYYYLGRAYHLNYQFNEALKYYSKFKEIATPSDLEELNVEKQIAACNHGKKLMANITDMIVLQKTELGAERFYDLYKLEDIGGTLLVTDQFQTKLDKKLAHRPVIHFPANSPYIYYSSYGDDAETGLDIYVIKKLPGGEWSLPRKVNGSVNTFLNEDYAYMHPNGDYLYFCSQGHNSMGGYDVFRSRYNRGDDSFSAPENLDFAISSPDDDFLFVVDSLNKNAYFSSARESSQGKLTVYKVRVDRIPMQMAVIKGSYFNLITNTDKEVKIEIEDFYSGRQIGTYNSKKSNGDYLITFPKSGKYKFFITPDGSDITHLAEVDIPFSKEFRPLKQQMTLKKDGGGEQLVEIDNLFDEEFDDPVAIMAEVYRQLAELPPNGADFNLDSLDALRGSDEVFAEAGLDPYTTKAELEKMLNNETVALNTSIELEKKQANVSFNLAMAKSQEANEKMVELNALLQRAENTNDSKEKNNILQQATLLKNEIQQLNQDAQNLIELGQEIDKAVAVQSKELGEIALTTSKVTAIGDDDREALTDFVAENKTFFKENINQKKQTENRTTTLIRASAKEQKDVQALSQEISELATTKKELLANQTKLQKQLANTNKKKEVEAIEKEITANEGDIIVVQESIEAKQAEFNKRVKNNEALLKGEAAALVVKDENNGYEMTKALSDTEKAEIYNTVKQNNLEENLTQIDKLFEENNVSPFNIELYGNNEEMQGYSLEDWDDAINAEQERLRLEKLAASEERQRLINAEIEKLERLRKEKQGQFEVVTDTENITVRPEINPEDILPNYTAKQVDIGEIVNEGDRKNAQLKLNYELADEIVKERKRLEEILTNDPKNKSVKERLENLAIIEADLKREIADDERWITENESKNSINSEDIVTSLAPNYPRNVNEAYELVDDDERDAAIGTLNERLVQKSNERLQELQAILATDPQNEKAQQEKERIVELQLKIAENKNEPLTTPTVFNIDDLDEDVALTDLITNYDSRAAEIEAMGDAYERTKAENELYDDVIARSRSKKENLARIKQEYPTNKTVKKREKALDDIIAEYESKIEKNDAWISKNKPETTTIANRDDVQLANPNYQTEIDKYANITDKKEREAAIEELNQATVATIDERLKQLAVELNENAANGAVSSEIQALVDVKAKIDENPTEPLLESSFNTDGIETAPTSNTVLPNYTERLEKIKSDENLSEEEKIKQKIELKTRLTERLDTEISNTNELKTYYPENESQLEERAKTLEALKQTQSTEIADLETELNALNIVAETPRPSITIGALMPDYQTDLEAIASAGGTEIERLERENELNNMLLGAIDFKISQLENEQATKPELTETLTAEINELNRLRGIKQTSVTENLTEIERLRSTTDVASTTNGVTDNGTTDTNTADTTENQENLTTQNNLKPSISVGQLIPDYDEQLATIRAEETDAGTRIKRENEVHQVLINRVDDEIENLKTQKTGNLATDSQLDKDIEALQNIKQSTLAKQKLNNDNLAELNEENVTRPTITLETLVPAFETKMEDIKNSDQSEKDKLLALNKMNEQLTAAIDLKIIAVQKELENDAENSTVYNEELDKLEELKEAKQNEIAQNNNEIDALVAKENSAAAYDKSNFTTQEGKNTLTNYQAELAQVDALNQELEELNKALDQTNDVKEIKKLNKEINTVATTKAKIENEVIEALAPVNNAETTTLKNMLEIDQQIATASPNETDEEIEKANTNLAEADIKLNTAKRLRNEAAETKDPIAANEKLSEALTLENEAKELIKEAQRIFKTARVIDQYEKDEEIITNVPDDVSARKSSALETEATNLEAIANEYYDRANALRDSSSTVKKKDQADVISKANNYQTKGDKVQAEADAIKQEAVRLKQQENDVLDVQLATVDIDVDDETTTGIAGTETYDEFYTAKSKGDEKLQEANRLEEEIEELKARKKRRIKMAVVRTSNSNTAAEQEIEEDGELATVQQQIDSLITVQKQLKEEAFTAYQSAQSLLDELDQTSQDNMLSIAQKSVAPIKNVEPAAVDYLIPANVETDIFRKTDESVYSEAAPIPMDESKTSGLIYKVQVGAFRNPLPQDHFKEFAPISGEKLNNGITRYMVGYFTTFAPADTARTEVNALGYTDAFVVAYCNGDRITIERAKLIEEGLIKCDATAETIATTERIINGNTTDNQTNQAESNTTENQSTNTNQNLTTDNNSDGADTQTDNQAENGAGNQTENGNENQTDTNNDNTTTTNTENNTVETIDPPREMKDGDQSDKITITADTQAEREAIEYYNDPAAADANQIEIIDGLFYTVQIGVYSKPVSNEALFGIEPLNTQKTPSGYIRYSTGIFKSEEDAGIRKDEVVNIGVKDAFVTAYYNGERITIEQALQILIRDGADALVGNYKPTNANESENELPAAIVYYSDELFYKVLVGKFDGPIPGEYATILLQGDGFLTTEVDAQGRTCLVSNKIESFESVRERINEFADLGIEDMDIITYYKYDVIPFEQGEKIKNGAPIKKLQPYDEIKGISADPYLYNPEAVYYKIKLGQFEDKISSEFTNLLLLHEAEENISKEETIDDEIIFYTGSIDSYKKAAETRLRLMDKGFTRATIIAYHKYEEISIEKAREITQE